MPFWNQLNGQQVWRSQSCYLVCTTGNSSIYATKRANARWANNNTGNAHIIVNNPNQAVFPGGSARVPQQPPVVPLNVDVQQIATAEFMEEAGIQVVTDEDGTYVLRNAVNDIAVALRASFYHGAGFHAMILWFNSVAELNAIAAAINWNIHNDDQRYAGAVPAPANGYIRSDDELAQVAVANHLPPTWQDLFGHGNQDWFLNIFNDAVNI
jgi:8-oxo-dGTP pyrophosphatase MutT (NUDIX family)